MTRVGTHSGEDLKLLSELLMAFKHHSYYSSITLITEARIRKALETGSYDI